MSLAGLLGATAAERAVWGRSGRPDHGPHWTTAPCLGPGRCLRRGQGTSIARPVCLAHRPVVFFASRQTMQPVIPGIGSTSFLSSSSAPFSCSTWCWACSRGKRLGCCLLHSHGTQPGLGVHTGGGPAWPQGPLPCSHSQHPGKGQPLLRAVILTSPLTLHWPWPPCHYPTLGLYPGLCVRGAAAESPLSLWWGF